jgi:predicted nucleotidyltransferase
VRLIEPLDDLFATGSHVRVLRALAALPPAAAVSGRELARRAGVSQPTARDVLASLERQGVLCVARALKRDSHRLNADHILVPIVRGLFDQERSIAADVEASITGVVQNLADVRAAYLFGSAARGDMRPDSDVDVAVESSRPIPDDPPDAEAFHSRFGNRINIIKLSTRGAPGLRDRIRAEGKPLPLRSRRRKS